MGLKGDDFILLPNKNEIIIEEIWKPITNEIVPNVAPIYLVSNYGRVYNNETGNYLPKNIYYDKDKYITIRLKNIFGNPIFVQMHRLVILSFKGFPQDPNMEPNHIDRVKYHNWIWNLEWKTHKENMQYSFKMGSFGIGETRHNSKLTNDQVRLICSLLEMGYTPSKISKMYKIDNCNVNKIASNIKMKLSWKHISDQYNFNKFEQDLVRYPYIENTKSSTTIESYKITPVEIHK